MKPKKIKAWKAWAIFYDGTKGKFIFNIHLKRFKGKLPKYFSWVPVLITPPNYERIKKMKFTVYFIVLLIGAVVGGFVPDYLKVAYGMVLGASLLSIF